MKEKDNDKYGMPSAPSSNAGWSRLSLALTLYILPLLLPKMFSLLKRTVLALLTKSPHQGIWQMVVGWWSGWGDIVCRSMNYSHYVPPHVTTTLRAQTAFSAPPLPLLGSCAHSPLSLSLSPIFPTSTSGFISLFRPILFTVLPWTVGLVVVRGAILWWFVRGKRVESSRISILVREKSYHCLSGIGANSSNDEAKGDDDNKDDHNFRHGNNDNKYTHHGDNSNLASTQQYDVTTRIRLATSTFFLLYSFLLTLLPLRLFSHHPFWPPALLGSGDTQNCWRLGGGVGMGVDWDFDGMEARLRWYYLMQGSYHLHSVLFSGVTNVVRMYLGR